MQSVKFNVSLNSHAAGFIGAIELADSSMALDDVAVGMLRDLSRKW